VSLGLAVRQNRAWGLTGTGERQLHLHARPGPAGAVENDPSAQRLHAVPEPPVAGAVGKRTARSD